MKNITKTRNYFLEEIGQNELMTKKNKNEHLYLSNYMEHFLISASTVTECISISAFASLLSTRMGFTSSAIRLKTCAITAGIKKNISIIKKK